MSTKKGSASTKKAGGSGKKAGSAKKQADSSTAPPTLETMTREQLLDEVKKFQTDINREREERNYFQIERDRVIAFWDISKNELEELRASLLNKDRDIEELEEKHQTEIKVYKQKVKHLLFEYQNNVENMQTSHTEALNIATKEYDSDHEQLRKDKRTLKLAIREMEIAHQDVIRNLKSRHDSEINTMRIDFERRAVELQSKFDYKIRSIREDTELRRKNEIHEIEERKNGQINALMKSHEKAFAEIKNYYNDITLNNLALINSLKEQVEEMKKKEERNEKLMGEITAENKRLSEPLQAALSEGELLRKQLQNYKKDKLALQNAQARLKVLNESHKGLTWEHDILSQKYNAVQGERDSLYSQFLERVTDVQQKSGFRNLLLEKKIDSLKSELEKKELKIHKQAASGKIDNAVSENHEKMAEVMIEAKNSQIHALKQELAKVIKAHNDLLKTFLAKMGEYGIRMDEYHLKNIKPSVPASFGEN